MNSVEEFTRLWISHQPAVAHYISLAITDFQAAEDVLQEVGIDALRKFAEYDPKRSFLSWVLGLARICVMRALKKQARSPLRFHTDLVERLADVCLEMAPELEARLIALQECLPALDGRVGHVVLLRYEQDLKPRQIAGQLHMTSGAVRVILYRVRGLLRQCIEEKLGSPR